jgi:hypothetical protein
MPVKYMHWHYSWEKETPEANFFSVRCSSEPVRKWKQKCAPDRREYRVESAARGQCALTTFFVSEMFRGDLDVQIEQYFTSQVTEMQITFTTSGFMLLFRVSFPWVLPNCTALKSLDNGQFSTVHQKHTIQKRIEGFWLCCRCCVHSV